MATKIRMSVSIRLALIEKLRVTVSKDQSPTARLFDSERASKAAICDAALEVAEWCLSGGFGNDMADAYAPEYKKRLLEVDKNAFMRGAHSMAKFLGAAVEVDADRRVITVTPPAALKDVAPGEIDATPLVEPQSPSFH